MRKYLIEVVEESQEAALRHHHEAIRKFGSHFAAHASWQCKEGACTRSMVVEGSERRNTLRIVPPNMRGRAQISSLELAA